MMRVCLMMLPTSLSSSNTSYHLKNSDTLDTVYVLFKERNGEIYDGLPTHCKQSTLQSSAERRRNRSQDFDGLGQSDCRDTRTSETPELSHKITEEPLWIDGLYDPSSGRGELGSQVIGRSSVVAEGKENEKEEEETFPCVGKEKKDETLIPDKVQEEQEEVEVLNDSISNHLEIQEEIDQPRSLVALLKASSKQKDLYRGSRIHAQIVRMGLLEKNVFVGNGLVSMYCGCGSLLRAQEVFDKLPNHNVVSWTALIAGYAQHGYGQEALDCFKQMQLEGLSPNAVTFVCALKACVTIQAIDKGLEIHSEIIKAGVLENHLIVSNSLIDMYAKFDLLAKAQEVFDELRVRDVVSWSALISGYAQHGYGEEALTWFKRMQVEGLSPNAVTFISILKACSSIKATDEGQVFHAEIVRRGLLEEHVAVGNALIDMYAKCGLLNKAQEMFDKHPAQDVVCWSALIAGYAQHGHGEQALDCFKQMVLEGLAPNAVTFLSILKACGSIGAVDKGLEVHDEIVREGFFENHVLIGNALVDMYGKFGLLAEAQEVFDELHVQDVVSWSALISGYTQHGLGQEALKCFEQMQFEALPPNAITFACILKGCGIIGAADKGQELHAEIVKEGLLERDVVVGNALVDMYVKCGLLAKAQALLDSLPVRDVVSWSALIAGYAQHGQSEEALTLLTQMQLEGLSPNAVTYVCILKACASTGAILKGQEIHDEIVREGLLEKHHIIGNALIDMYAKCGLIAKAQDVFNHLTVQDLVSWNALITGYALLGKAENVLNLCDKMLGEGIKPTLVTFTLVLNACCHAGLLDKGLIYFETMTRDYGIVPTLEHHTCMVDLFARSGHLDKAVALIKEMPFSPNLTPWHIVLSACRKWRNINLGRLAFEQAVQLDEKDDVAFICMSNIYADAGRTKDSEEIEAMRVSRERASALQVD